MGVVPAPCNGTGTAQKPVKPALLASQVIPGIAQDLAFPPVHLGRQRLHWRTFFDGTCIRAMDEQSDEALMARVARGDEAAFRLLARRHVPAAVALARRILRNGADAEDVAQDAMLRVWKNAPRWQPIATFRTWLTRIVVNLCIDRQRRVSWLGIEAAGDVVDPAPDAAAQRETSDTARLVDQAIGELPPRQRAAIVLTYREGMSNAQTAEILDTSVSAVETLLVRAKDKLRQKLGPVLDKE